MRYNLESPIVERCSGQMECDVDFFIGLDIGGTKIAGAVFANDERGNGREIGQEVLPTPSDYPAFLKACKKIVDDLERRGSVHASIGIGLPGVIDRERDNVFAPNVPFLEGNRFRRDMSEVLGRPVTLGNDATCAALSEAVDGAGAGHHIVFSVIMGTGVGGGLAIGGHAVEGPNGLTGEWGHLPLPFREAADGPETPCGCGQPGCIDKSISGPALSRLYEMRTAQKADAGHIRELALGGNEEALQALDTFYTVAAKAMVTIIHTFDPDVIVVSGGLSGFTEMYEEVPKRWTRYALRKNLRTRLVPAKHGAMSGLRGAAWLGRKAVKAL